MANNRLSRLAACLLIGLGGCSSLLAQYELKSGVYNSLSQRVPANNTGKIAPVGPTGTPLGDPTILPQYSNVVGAAGSAGPIASGYPKSTNGIKLSFASVGTGFASGVPRYFYGDQIVPPIAITSTGGTQTPIASPSTYWRAEPVAAGEVLTNPSGAPATDYGSGESAAIASLATGVLPSYYYSPHAKVVFANSPGTVEITWRSAVPDPTSNSYVFYKERFNVSSATSTPVRTIFWTEKSYNGPRVAIPSGRIVTVNPVYSNVFPETVATEYVVAGSSSADPNAEATQVLRTLWYEKSNGIGELHAYNQVGRILVEYLGALREDGTHEFLGADIVSVEQAAVPKTITTYLGNEIRPEPDEDLTAVPVTSSSTTDVAYYGSNPRPDGSLAYFAERENDIEDRVSFYWLENHDAEIALTAGASPGLSIDWPKYLNKYLQFWPDDITEFASSTVAQGGSSTATGTGLKFEDGKIPTIIYQDDANGAESVIDTVSQRLIVGLGVTQDQQNRSLLKFTGDNGGIWYVRLITQAEDRSGYQEGDGGAALVIGDLNALRRADYTDDEWAWHHGYNDEKQWSAPVDEAGEGGVLALLAAAKFVDAYAVLELERRIEHERRIELERRIEHERRIGESQPSWRAPPWTAHVRDEARPPCRIDYVHSRPPSAPGGRRFVPLAAAVESNCGEASDHQPLVLDFEATAFDAGE